MLPAELRVYEPLTEFSDPLVLGARGRSSAREAFEAQAYENAMARLMGHERPDVVRVIEYQGSEYFCPEEYELRTHLLLDELDMTYPAATVREAIPEGLRNSEPETVPHTQTANWGISGAWFMSFSTDDLVTTGNHPVTGAFTARITTPLVEALERVRYSAHLLNRTNPDWVFSQQAEDLAGWLELFNPTSVLELDYGWLAAQVWPDESVFDLRTAIDSLEDGDLTTALTAYQRWMRRWAPVLQRSVIN